MTDRPQLLAGLLARRQQLVVEISAAEARLRHQYETLQSLDHLIRLEDEEIELPRVPFSANLEKRRASTLIHGEVGRLCLEALRGRPGEVLTTREVIDYIARKRELVFATRTQQKHFSSSVAMALARYGRKGLVLKVGSKSNGQGMWTIPPG